MDQELPTDAAPLVVTTRIVVRGTVNEVITVEPGGELILFGTAASHLVVKLGGAAVVHGTVRGAVLTEGRVVVAGVIRGRLVEGQGAQTSIERGASVNGERRR